MTHPRTNRMKNILPLATLLLTVAASLALTGCGKKFEGTPLIVHEIGSPKVTFGEATLNVLPPPEGPYAFVKLHTASIIEMNGPSGKNELFRLIGLAEEGYPAPEVDAEGKPLPKPEPPAIVRRTAAMRAFKVTELSKLCLGKQFYIIRMTPPAVQQPSRIYALIPDAPQTPGKPPTGEATLLNALALRNGIANLDLATPQQPLFATMLDCQLVFIAEMKKKAGTPGAGNDLWSQFPQVLPKGPYTDRLAEIEKTH